MTPLSEYPLHQRAGKFIYRFVNKNLSKLKSTLMIKSNRSLEARVDRLRREVGMLRSQFSINQQCEIEVLIVTDVPFWRAKLGNHCRILSLFRCLSDVFCVRVLYIGWISVHDCERIQAQGLSRYIDFLSDCPHHMMGAFDGSLRTIKINQFNSYVGARKVSCVIFEYVRLQYLIQNQDTSFYKILDSHDIFHQRELSFNTLGISDSNSLQKEEELSMMSCFDCILAIQLEERSYLKEHLPERTILTVGHTCDYDFSEIRESGSKVVFVGGASPHNVKSIEWFLDYVYPLLDLGVYQIHIFGRVCEFLNMRKENLFLHGPYDDASLPYKIADIVINPAVIGSGLKIKSVEAIHSGLPLVTTSIGAQGLPYEIIYVADGVESFARRLQSLIDDSEGRKILSGKVRQYVLKHFTNQLVYGELIENLRGVITQHPKAKENPTLQGDGTRLLVVGRGDESFYIGDSFNIKNFKNSIFCPESDSLFDDVDILKGFMNQKCIDSLFFLNPYGTTRRLDIYKRIRSSGISFITFDRGALPHSWFFDNRGFNHDSSSYDPIHWDQPLSDMRRASVKAYINKLNDGSENLEKQGSRMTERQLRDRYGLGNRKVLFLPFQRPSDTVTKYMAGLVGDMVGFLKFINEVSLMIDSDEWVFIGKRHPLECEDSSVEGMVFVDPNVHIYDLLNLSDRVVLLNSGVGVLAMMLNKPTYIVGDAFYAIDGVNKGINSPSQLLCSIEEPYTVNREKVLRFISYLKDDFYSFADSKSYIKTNIDGSMRSITTSFTFTHVRNV